ncbi:MAG: transglutaminase family protein, partial [Pseudomonadota bacterium]
EALWRDDALIADEKPETPATLDDARGFADALAEALGLSADFAQPLYEDPLEYLKREADLPDNLTVGDNKLDDPVERRRITRVFAQGLSQPVAFVLPLRAAWGETAKDSATDWISEMWGTRLGGLRLLPGDSPAGLRLPTRSLPHIDPDLYPHVFDPDPFAEKRPLPTARAERPNRKPAPPPPDRPLDPKSAEAKVAAAKAVRTALTIEPRDGALYVFLPPVASAAAYVDLVMAIEAAAAAIGRPVRVEGYGPPRDPRFKEIKVTPDPGVIEINIHPTDNWADQRDAIEALYAEARACGLDASSFMIDGRPTGSGGGAHITVGGETPADSPFLRRPDVLGSLIRFWQNHPSLSYFFSGLFIGPTSQAPRADEARTDLIYEVELALQQLPGPKDTDFPPWLVDRVLRHLLVDVTGNTHRAEICIDKLYSPDCPTGRLGIVEFRAFEMPPHWRMNAVQQLVLRALIAWFWKTPYVERLVPHGLALHDRFMLPDVLWADFGHVLDKLSNGLGVRFEPEWFRAQYDFRFPLAGLIEHDGVVLELRSAIEPWHVLGEEGAGGGVARFVDSSLERLQAALIEPSGPSHLQLACNGALVPLQSVDRADRRIGGVRFRSWLPTSCLHPTIPAQKSLVFDLVDPTAGRAVAGCTYHPTHPGGRNFETRPVNALEAEGRRLARFEPIGHTPGAFRANPVRIDPRTPWTLDLRQVEPFRRPSAA